MKRILISISVLMLLLLGLCACGGKEDPPEHTHNGVKVAAVAATCTEAGNNEYYTCDGCDKVFTDAACTNETTVTAQTVAALGHSFTDNCDTDCNNSGCTHTREAIHTPNEDDGDCTTAITCKECGAITTEGKAAHTPNDDDGDCTTDITCSVCGTVTTEGAQSHIDGDENEICDECGSDYPHNMPEGTGGGEIDLGKDEFN